MGYFYIILTVLLTAAGQLLTKKGAREITMGDKISAGVKTCFNRYIIAAAVITAAAPVFYIMALKEISLSVAFAFTGLNYIFVGLGGKLFFGEKLNGFHYAGMILVFTGIAVFNY